MWIIFSFICGNVKNSVNVMSLLEQQILKLFESITLLEIKLSLTSLFCQYSSIDKWMYILSIHNIVYVCFVWVKSPSCFWFM